MPITGMWQDAVSIESGALKWGSGINPIHAIEDSYGGRSDKRPHTATGPEGIPGGTIDQSVVEQADPLYGYTTEDYASMIWGYGPQTGTSDRPGMDGTPETTRGDVTKGFPPWGPQEGGIPAGNYFRAQNHGGLVDENLKLGYKEETVGEGWENKRVTYVNDAETSNPDQYERQTSMQQRDQVRRGSQNPNTGTASEFVAPIGSQRPTWGMRWKPWSGGRRHWDMQPKEQNQVIRPFWYRNAATGYVEYMETNEATNYQVHPMQRQPVPDPYAGVPTPAAGNVYQEESYPVQDYVNVWY